MKRPVPDCEGCAGTGFLDVGKTKPCSCPHDGLTDAELIALANLVHATAMQCKSFDEWRLSDGLAVGYGDQAVEGQDQLRAELKRRGVL